MLLRRGSGASRCFAAVLRSGHSRCFTVASSKYTLPPVPDISLTELLFSRVKAFGDAPALIDGPSGRTIRFNEIEPMVRACAAGLSARGLGQGDVIGLLSPNSIDYPIALFGAASIGAAVTTLNPLYTPDEISKQLEDAKATQLYTTGPLLEKAYAAAAKGARLSRVYTFDAMPEVAPDGPPLESFASLLADGGSAPTVAITPADDVVFIPYSSGTSGLPKGVELTHRNLVANVLQALDPLPAGSPLCWIPPAGSHAGSPPRTHHILSLTSPLHPSPPQPALHHPDTTPTPPQHHPTPSHTRPTPDPQTNFYAKLTPDDTLIGVLPFYHIYGFTVILNVALCAGSTVVTMPGFEPSLFLQILKEHSVTVAHVAPPLVGCALRTLRTLQRARCLPFFCRAASSWQRCPDPIRSVQGRSR